MRRYTYPTWPVPELIVCRVERHDWDKEIDDIDGGQATCRRCGMGVSAFPLSAGDVIGGSTRPWASGDMILVVRKAKFRLVPFFGRGHGATCAIWWLGFYVGFGRGY